MRGHGRARTALAELSDPMFESLRPITLAAAGILALTGMAIATAQSSERPEYSGTAVKSLTAPLKDGTGATIGSVQMWEDANGVVKIFVGASGLTAGDHGIHVHAVGQCTPAAFTSAGGHYNPGAKKHGLESPDGHHAGDLPNLEVNADGTTAWVTTTNDVTLTAGREEHLRQRRQRAHHPRRAGRPGDRPDRQLGRSRRLRTPRRPGARLDPGADGERTCRPEHGDAASRRKRAVCPTS